MTLSERIRASRVLRTLHQFVRRFVVVMPYWVIREYADSTRALQPALQGQTCTTRMLAPSDIPAMLDHPDNVQQPDAYQRRFDEGHGCMGLFLDGTLAAYSWFDPVAFDNGWMRYRLAEDEAYLYDAVTFRSCRGRRLAPFLRNALYNELQRQGLRRFCSITLATNPASLRFKEKLGARKETLYLYIRLLGRYAKNIPLRHYPS